MIRHGIFGNNTVEDRDEAERPSFAGMIALFVLQVCLSGLAVVMAVFGGMAIASCGPP